MDSAAVGRTRRRQRRFVAAAEDSAFAFEAIRQSWERRDPSLYGRFDFAYGGEGDAKLLEYNADTPTSLFESAVVQWFWVEQMIERGQLRKAPINSTRCMSD